MARRGVEHPTAVGVSSCRMRVTKATCHLVWLCLLPALATAQERVTGLDGIRCSDPLPKLRDAAYELHDTRLELRDGKACIKGFLGGCEWTIELIRSERWGAGDQFLLVVVRSEHDSPGAWDYVFHYTCNETTYVPAFSVRYLYGAKIELLPPSDFLITYGVWLRGDPGCCPSREQTAHYRWRASEKRFVRIGLRDAPVRRRAP
jgi:hypothetical protein